MGTDYFALACDLARAQLHGRDDWLTHEPDPCAECPRCPECTRCLAHDDCECWMERRDECWRRLWSNHVCND